MTDNIISIDRNKPHTRGPWLCTWCGHEFEAVVLSGKIAIDCPECKLSKAVRAGFIFPMDHSTFRCLKCDVACSLWTIIDNGEIMCAHCGDCRPWPPLPG